jgi:5-hydroxyisourate hydrolase-like protein (transthyretin family)
MGDNNSNRQIIRTMAIAIVIALAGIAILGWQYRQLEKQQLPAIEEKIEQNSAQDVLERFLETKADSLLTERAMEQKNQREIFLAEDDGDYEILKVEKSSEGEYQFFVKIGDYIHVIDLIKISDKYYIDSVEIAG